MRSLLWPGLAALLLSLSVVWSGCRQMTADEERGPLLARVGNRSLYMSDLEGMIPTETSAEDSALIINAFVEHWAREAVVLNHAERVVSQDINVDKLVEDYRASLLRSNFERLLIERELDTTVSRQQLEDYYRNSQDKHILKSDLVRGYFVQLPEEAPQRKEQFELWWKNPEENYDAILAYCEEYAPRYLLADSSWYEPTELQKLWPGNSLSANELVSKQTLHRKKDGMHYYYHRLEVVRKGQPAPLNYVADQLKELILHRRKKALLKRLKEEMYQQAQKDREVKIFIE